MTELPHRLGKAARLDRRTTQGPCELPQPHGFHRSRKAALELAERETVDAHTVDDELWARLKQHYDDGQIIELCAAIGVFNYFNRFNDALKMEPTK